MVSSNRGYPDPDNPSEDLSPNDEIIIVADTDTDEEDHSHNDYQPLPTHEVAETSDEEGSENENQGAAAPDEASLPPITPMEEILMKDVWTGPTPADIEMDSNKVDEVKQAMMNFTLPPSSIPEWAKSIPEEQWKQQLISRLQRIQKKGE